MERIEPPPGVDVLAPIPGDWASVLSPEALSFVADLHRRFDGRRRTLLALREERAEAVAGGRLPDFLPDTKELRESDWRVAEAPDSLVDRRVEITGPAEPKMMVNGLNSGARAFMADLEDALSPTWANVLRGQHALRDASRRRLSFVNSDGKNYRLADETATLLVRPRGWHLEERHLRVDGTPVSAALFDAGLFLFHNGSELAERRSGPFFYLPKLESHLEARLWNDVFTSAQHQLGLPHGTIRATVLIETIAAAFEMEEILYELRDHASGLNAGRWDYIFSIIRLFSENPEFVLPNRGQVAMTVPFMRSYAQLLVQTCHRRGAHAIGGMSAFIPNRREPEVTATALSMVRQDKQREAGDGFDGTWVAHPDLVSVAAEVFTNRLGTNPHQKARLLGDLHVRGADLLDVRIQGGVITEDGVRMNVHVALVYLDSWLRGTGAAAIANLMEDAATAEICRSQLWQWIRHAARLDSGQQMSPALYRAIRTQEVARLRGPDYERIAGAADLLDQAVLSERFVPFLTSMAYEALA